MLVCSDLSCLVRKLIKAGWPEQNIARKRSMRLRTFKPQVEIRYLLATPKPEVRLRKTAMDESFTKKLPEHHRLQFVTLIQQGKWDPSTEWNESSKRQSESPSVFIAEDTIGGTVKCIKAIQYRPIGRISTSFWMIGKVSQLMSHYKLNLWRGTMHLDEGRVARKSIKP